MRIQDRPPWKPNPRTDAQLDLQSASSPTDTYANPPVCVWLAREDLPPPAIALNLSCMCEHPRLDHRGLRLEISGNCLECGCQGFVPAHGTAESDEQLRGRIRAALDRATCMEQIVANLRSRNGSALRWGPSVLPPASSDGEIGKSRGVFEPGSRD